MPAAGGWDKADAGHGRRLPVVLLAALGIVFGDIGTSPLYTMREAEGVRAACRLARSPPARVPSLVFWALVLVVTVKDVLIIMHADNQVKRRRCAGLRALAQRACAKDGACVGSAFCWRWSGQQLFFCDGILTSAGGPRRRDREPGRDLTMAAAATNSVTG